MPNHVTNIITFSDKVDEILQFIKGESEIDFNKIIPMPKTLDITSGTSTDNGKAIVMYKEYGDDKLLREKMQYQWVREEIDKNKPVDELEFVCQLLRANLVEGRMAIENEKKYGHDTWHSWSCENWGTKWNAYEISILDNGVRFQTAWSCPFPVISKLAELFPGVVFNVKYADEDTGSNCGEFSTCCENGKVEEEWDFSGNCDIYSQAFAYHVYAGGEGEIDVIPVVIDNINNNFYKGKFDDEERLVEFIEGNQEHVENALKYNDENWDKDLLKELINVCINYKIHNIANVANSILNKYRTEKIERILNEKSSN